MQRKLTTKEVEEILSKIKYKDWTLRVIEKTEDAILCQWIFYAIDNDKPNSTDLEAQHCRKWYVSCYSTDSEVIRTAHLAVQQAELHEINENFTYNDVRLFDPHIDLIALSKRIEDIGQDVRDEKNISNTPDYTKKGTKLPLLPQGFICGTLKDKYAPHYFGRHENDFYSLGVHSLNKFGQPNEIIFDTAGYEGTCPYVARLEDIRKINTQPTNFSVSNHYKNAVEKINKQYKLLFSLHGSNGMKDYNFPDWMSEEEIETIKLNAKQ